MDRYDSLYGHPGASLQKRMQSCVNSILNMDSWAPFLKIVGLTPRDGGVDVFMTQLLRQSWQNSLRKGYHRKVRLVYYERTGVPQIACCSCS